MVIALALMIEINFLELAVSSTVKLSKVEPNLFHSSKNQDVNPSCPWQGILSERGPVVQTGSSCRLHSVEHRRHI